MMRTLAAAAVGAVVGWAGGSTEAGAAAVEEEAAAALAVDMPAPARTEPTLAEQAERRCKEGSVEAALGRFRDAWHASGDLAVVRRMGDCAARRHDWNRAHKLYAMYLRRAPEAADYDLIASRFVILDDWVARENGAAVP